MGNFITFVRNKTELDTLKGKNQCFNLVSFERVFFSFILYLHALHWATKPRRHLECG